MSTFEVNGATIQKLDVSKHKTSKFSSVNHNLNLFLRKHAHLQANGGFNKTYVLCTKENDSIIIGYYTLSPHSLRTADLPATSIGAIRYSEVGAILLGRLAVDKRFSGSGWGSYLLFDAMSRAYRVMGEVGGIALVVDVEISPGYDPAVFYAKHDFVPCIDTPGRMYVTTPMMLELLRVAGFESL